MKTSFPLLFSALAAGVLASPVLRRQNVVLNEATFTEMQFFAQYAGAGYCNNANTPGELIICSNNTCPLVEANKAFTVDSFTGNLTDEAGFVAVDPVAKLIVISFKGSNTLPTFLTDADFAQVECDLVADCLVHQGFYTAWQELEAGVMAGVASATAQYPDFALVATGHSLGAAVATIAAAYLRQAGHALDLYTYGSPRVGNAAFADFVTGQLNGVEWRVTHLDDPVPRLPPLLVNYRHTSPEYWLSDGTSNTTAYTLGDIVVCTGNANTTCNAGQDGFDVTAHLFYLDPITACDADGLHLRRRLEGRGEDRVAARLSEYAELDRRFAETLEAGA